MKSIAIILARGGSKRLPKKNIMDFYGKPLVAWTIEAAVKSKKFDKVLVSTDDSKIAEISKNFGAEVPFLRVTASDDITPSSSATIAALKQAEEHWNIKFDIVSQLMANCPMRGSDVINRSIENFLSKKNDSQLSCFPFGWMNPWWAFELEKHGNSKKLFPAAFKERSQDLPKLYCPTGAIWISKSKVLKTEQTFYSSKHVFFPIDWHSAVDIDDAEDFEMAKAIYSLKERV